jgi:type IV pilus assembly protein PilE
MKIRRNHSRGFTLLELMIVVGIVGILAVVAYPSYLDSVRKSRRADGIAAILSVQLAQERLRANCRFFAGNLSNAATACGASAADSSILSAANSGEGFYAIAVSNASATSYTVTATGLMDQAMDEDNGTTCTLVLTVDAANPAGARTPAGCWD